jgi:type II restriction enzyme
VKEHIKTAILDSFVDRERAAEVQIERGIVDAGLRSQVTSGKHLDKLVGAIVGDLSDLGFDRDDISVGNRKTELPGWFRATKRWDILGFSDSKLATAIELKSIYGSYGNNLNNRAEEAIGDIIDVRYAVAAKLIDCSSPVFAYVLIVKKDVQSSGLCRDPNEPHFNADRAFRGNSYIDRFATLCRRLREDGLYDAVWFVVADPVANSVEEPDSDLNYEMFIARIGESIRRLPADRAV